MPDERFPNDELDNRLSDIDRRMGEIDQRTDDTSFGDRTLRGRDIPPNDRVIRHPEPLIETNETRERERQTAADARAAYGRETQVDRTTERLHPAHETERVYDREHLHPAHEHDRGKVWPWVLGLAILGLIALPMLNHRNDNQASRPAQTQVGSKQVGPAVNFQGKSYVGAGQAHSFAAADMVAVGKTAGGSTVYRAKGGGGGTGTNTYYIRHADGTFQALAPYNP